MPSYSISHRTRYVYSAPVIQSHHLLHLTPRELPHQKTERHEIIIEPKPKSCSERVDYFGNPTMLITVEDDHREFTVTARSGVNVSGIPTPDLASTTRFEDIAERRIGLSEGLDKSILDYAGRTRLTMPTPSVLAFARDAFPQGTPVLLGAKKLMQRIFEEFAFDNSATDVSTPVDQILEQRSGVCQDFAHLQITALRALNLPVRYVSGYIRTNPPEGGERLAGADASHAWVSVWAPETGWVDFDPTNNLTNSADHVTVAFGRDYDDVSPVSGVLLGGGAHSVTVAVDVVPI